MTGSDRPRQFSVQDIQIISGWTDKPLYGRLQFPVAIARSRGKITGKANSPDPGLLYSDIFFGLAPATGQFAFPARGRSIPAVTPYTVTVANAANNDDLGVVYATGGKRFNRVTAPSATIGTPVNSGIYTFSSTDANAAVLVSYYNLTTSGSSPSPTG